MVPINLSFEVREQGGDLHGVIVQEGRAASGGRAEVFAPGSISWPADGVAIRTVHRGAAETRAYPHRDAMGRISIRATATAGIRAAIQSGKKFMSIEFKALEERTTQAGVREVLRAFVDAAALVSHPEYDTTAAEVRSKAGRLPVWL